MNPNITQEVPAIIAPQPNLGRDIIAAWKGGICRQQDNCLDHIAYKLAKALHVAEQRDVDMSDSDTVALAVVYLRQMFTPIQNAKKLANGRKPHDSMLSHVYYATTTDLRAGGFKFSASEHQALQDLARSVHEELRLLDIDGKL